ncbi:MobV family relaxase [Pseudomonas sp. TH10]|uniref:MobV family relaxase n=1 Tax=Pseudomonas sp. TH10 TaxID=2796376 RepID=UPI001F5BCD68|nr:MobV family relaxase [Pseudomonas sp. TH10]
MGYAILRAKKLKSFGAVVRSARHTHREQPTPNADPAMTRLNKTVGAKGADQVLAALKRTLPTKRRKDAVLAIEYLVTASPEDFKRHGGRLDDTGDGYFADALKWLQAKHGRMNVISATIHLDESTPHMIAYVVPMTADKRLSCRDFLGGPEKLRAMQTDFHAKIGAPRCLERGVEGSKAKHETMSSFYATMTAANEAPALKPKDYAAAAMGIKTEAWRQAEDLAKANAVRAAREPKTKKSTWAKAKAVKKQADALEKKQRICA